MFKVKTVESGLSNYYRNGFHSFKQTVNAGRAIQLIIHWLELLIRKSCAQNYKIIYKYLHNPTECNSVTTFCIFGKNQNL